MPSPFDDVPLKPAPWAQPRRVPLVLGPLAAAAAALPCVRALSLRGETHADEAASATAVVLSTAALTAALLFFATRARTRGGVVATLLLGGGAAGALNAGVSLVLVTLVHDGRFEPALLPLGAFFGSFFAAPLGFAYGLALLAVAVPAVRAEGAPSFEGFDRVLAIAGAWTVAVAIGCAAANEALLALDALALATGGAALLVGALRLTARRAWLARVRAGMVDGWRVEPRAAGEAEGAPPFVRARFHDEVLVKVGGAARPYRDVPQRQVVARIG